MVRRKYGYSISEQSVGKSPSVTLGKEPSADHTDLKNMAEPWMSSFSF